MSLETEIRNKLVEFISHNFAVEKSEINNEESLLDQGIVDSFGFVECVSFIEKEFTISIPEERLTRANFGSVNKMTKLIANEVVCK